MLAISQLVNWPSLPNRDRSPRSEISAVLPETKPEVRLLYQSLAMILPILYVERQGYDLTDLPVAEYKPGDCLRVVLLSYTDSCRPQRCRNSDFILARFHTLSQNQTSDEDFAVSLDSLFNVVRTVTTVVGCLIEKCVWL